MDAQVSFGCWLEKRRKALDLTREELAQKVGCSISTLRKIESDERHPSKQLAELLANALVLRMEERLTFIRIARGEIAIERMKSAAPLPDLNLLQSSENFSKHIPVPPTPLIGREAELSALCQMLGDRQCRLITLFGPGGIGKTRLAIETAIQQNREYCQGVAFVSLASVNSASLLAQVIANALEFSFQRSGEPKTQLIDYLREKKQLLVLDNFEHLMDATGLLVEIIRSTAQVKILCTSREQLNVQGEWVFEVRGLSICEAEALFVNSARRVQANFVAREHHKPTIIRICHLTEGIPLAIELAATWIRILSLSEIEQEIQRNLDFLSTTMRDLAERHRSMRAVFDHSWDLLTREEQQVLSYLSVFRGGFTRDAAEQIAGAKLDLLSALVAKSFIQRSEEKRFSLHELVRQFTVDRLEVMHQTEQIQQRHIAFFADFAERCKEQFGGLRMTASMEQMECENDNLRAALDYTIRLQASQLALRLGAALWSFWQYRGQLDEGLRWLKAVLALPEVDTDEYPLQRAKALIGAGALARIQGDFVQARSLYEESLALQRKTGNSRGVAAALNSLGILTIFEGQYNLAEAYFRQSLQICHELGSQGDIVKRLNNLGVVAMYQGEYEKARLLHEEAMEIYRERNDQHGIASSLGNLGDVFRYQGQCDRAMQVLEESLAIFHELRDVHAIVITLGSMARVQTAKGNIDEALTIFHKCLTENREVGDKTEMANSLEGITDALLAHARHSPTPEDEIRLAVRLLAAAGHLRATVGAPRSAAERTELDRIIVQLRGQLSESDFVMELNRGAEMTIEQAVEIALIHVSKISAATDVD